VTPGETLTKGNDDPKAKFLREKLDEALVNLEPLFQNDCTRQKALKCWDKVYATEFFSDRYEPASKASASVSAPALSGLFSEKAPPAPVRKEGGGRYA
jgi:hypothetical protein